MLSSKVTEVDLGAERISGTGVIDERLKVDCVNMVSHLTLLNPDILIREK